MSTDAGITWTTVIEGTIVFDVTKHPDGDIIALTNDGMMLSSDSGITWMLQNTGQPNFDVIDVDTSGNLYAVNYNGLLKSADKGITWQQVAPMPENDIDSFQELHIDNQGSLYTLSEYYYGGDIYHYLHHLIDESTGEWNEITPFGENNFMDFHIDEQGFLLAITGYGLFRSVDKGNNWELITESEDKVVIRAVTSTAEGRLYASFDDAGVWVSDTYVSTITLPQAASNLRVYPNPASGTFYIEAGQIPASSVFRIYNMQGMVVNEGTITPNGKIKQITHLAPGIYTVRLEAESVKVVIK